ncbi:MAG: hypothetical protein M3323_08480 [Actinomycetota bacterium]|nr:hypothetical protein [Actinomycetota bacterium]
MNRGRLQRGALLVLILVAALFAQTAVSTAQPPGSELAEDVPSEVVGSEASVAVLDVSAFPSAGNAVFEPGTINEETFSYSSIDETSSLLVGVTRPTPLAHAAGAFVQAPAADFSDAPRQPLAPPASAPPLPALDGETESSNTVSDPCYESTGQMCDEKVAELVQSTEPCQDIIDQTCEDRVAEVVQSTDACDPDNTGQTCEEFVVKELESTCASVTAQWQEACLDVAEQAGPGCFVSAEPLLDCVEEMRQRLLGMTAAIGVDQPNGGFYLMATTDGGPATPLVYCGHREHATWPPGPGPKFLTFGAGIICVGSAPPTVLGTGSARLDVHIDQPNDPDNALFVIHDQSLPYLCIPCNNNARATAKPHPVFNGVRYQVAHEFTLTSAGGVWFGSDQHCLGWATPELHCLFTVEFRITKAGSE